jgi:hypothetical protein
MVRRGGKVPPLITNVGFVLVQAVLSLYVYMFHRIHPTLLGGSLVLDFNT